ncbi:DedA family protein [Pseudooceanicola onchidii]|uniref:DedA family protein n=1 Tax=Pseudooceanicola onchidii TaxID=2562279 RepID=UPI00145A3BDF|nr:DedA family protein [Pseudooceanicola onchidii]
MNETLLSALTIGGVPVLMLVTFLSCLAMPVPSSLLMLAAGALTASGDLSLGWVFAGAYVGAVAGDQVGYRIGRSGGSWAKARMKPGSKPALAMQRAERMMEGRAGPAVFLSRWLFSPLGPYVNFAAGGARIDRRVFTIWGAAGELVWVAIYVGLGYAFGEQIDMVAELSSDVAGLLAALAVMVGAGFWMRRALRRAHRAGDRDAGGDVVRTDPRP